MKLQIIRSLGSIGRSFFPFQFPVLQFWDNNILFSLNPYINVVISIVIFAYTCILLAKNRLLLCMYSLATLGMLFLYYCNLNCCNRHFGYQYIIFFAVLWLLDKETNERRLPRSLEILNKSFYSLRNRLLYFVLSAQILCSIMPVSLDLFYPFSPGKHVAQWIKDSNRTDWLIAGYPQYYLTSIVGYLDKRIYALEFDRMLACPNVTILEPVEGRTPLPEILAKVPQLKDTYGSQILFMFAAPIDPSLLTRYGLQEAARFNTAITDEKFYIYVIKGEL